MKRFFIACVVFFCSINSHGSWDGIVTGKIRNLDVVVRNGDNYGVRITFTSRQPLCGNSNVWAYINKSDDNYDVSVKALLAAKMSGKEVMIHTVQATRGFCHIGYITIK